jgi:hypothetical protein
MNSLSPYPNGAAMQQGNPIPAGFTKEKLNGLVQVNPLALLINQCFTFHPTLHVTPK